MDPAALAAQIEAIDGRLAGTDAERRAAALCARALRSSGRRPRTQAVWFRAQRAAPRALAAAVGVAGSVVSADHPVVGLALVGGALLATLLAAAGLPTVGALAARRATQNVVAAPPSGDGPVLLVLAASVDSPRSALLTRGERWLRERLGGGLAGALAPGALGIHVAALAWVVACAAVRVGGAAGTALGAVQLVPTIALIVLVGLWLDLAYGRPEAAAPAGGPAAALAVAAALDARPPRNLRVEVLIAGAGEAGAAGMRAYVRARRRTLAAEEVVVLQLRSAPGPPRFLVRDGEIVGVRLHPQLVALAAAAAGEGAASEGRSTSGARVARGARWPALALEGEPRRLAELVLRLVTSVDAELGRRREAPRRRRIPFRR